MLKSNRLSIDAVARGLAGTSSSTATRPLYLGQVGTNCKLPNSLTVPNKQSMTRTPSYIRDNITSLSVIVPNFYVTGVALGEKAPGAVATCTATVEWPIGTIYGRFTFSGSNTGTVPDGGFLVSDPLSVNIPANTLVFIRIWKNSSAGIIYWSYNGTHSGGQEIIAFGATTPDLTGGGVITPAGSSSQLSYGPCGLIGYTSKPSFALVGDSRTAGVDDVIQAPVWDEGDIAHSIGSAHAYMNLGVSGDTLTVFIGSHTNRVALAAYCSTAIIELGINDVSGGSSAATIRTNTNTVQGYFTAQGQNVYLTTMEPVSTSTDGWVTTTNQTTIAQNAARVTENNARRAVPTGSAGCFDVASAVEFGTDSGIWQAPGGVAITVDGTHETPGGYLQVQQQGVIAPAGLA